MTTTPSPADLDTLSLQLGRPVRGVVEIPARCLCGNPLVAATAPRLTNGIPFPTTFYLTHPTITAAVSRIEARGDMTEMNARLGTHSQLAQDYAAAHQNYLQQRERIRQKAGIPAVTEIAHVTAGGMPQRVKCLHALVGHSLAVGAGINPFGDETLEKISAEWNSQRCTCAEAWDHDAEIPTKDLSRHVRQTRAESE